jgi:hypothetical protein
VGEEAPARRGIFLRALFENLYSVGVLLAGCVALFTVDRLVRLQYAFHRQAWEADGKPNGMLFRPPESEGMSSSWALQRCLFVWSFKSPEWMRQDQKALRLVLLMRVSLLIFNGGVVAYILYMTFASYVA